VIPDRQFHRSLVIALLAAVSMFLPALMSIISVPIARADDPDDPLNALMMGGTTMPTPSIEWQDRIITDYIDPATGQNYIPVLVPTPESLATTSLPIGLADLQAAMAAQQAADPGQPYLVEGISQSAQIAVEEKIQLMQAGQHTDVTFLVLGDPNRPDGGIDERFAGLYTPGLEWAISPAPSRPMPVFPPSTSPTSTTPSLTTRNSRSTRWPT
jgi:hypothetical protein